MSEPSLDLPWTDREHSWLDFNHRVLALARRSDVPLLERLKFVAIAAEYLDEFHMIRVPRVAPPGADPDRRAKRRRLEERGRDLAEEIAEVFGGELRPRLEAEGIEVLPPDRVEARDLAALKIFHRDRLRPCLTPVGVEDHHPFPILRGGAIYLAVRTKPIDEPGSGETLSLVQVPSSLPRFVELADSGRFVALEDVIRRFLGEAFTDHAILEATEFRVTRASELDIEEDDTEDLLSTIADELRRRDHGEMVRLELSASTSPRLARRLLEATAIAPHRVASAASPIALSGLMSIYQRLERPDLRYRPFRSTSLRRPGYSPSMFRSMREGDILLHHPYDAHLPIIDLLEEAAADPDVVAIKQTLYRTSGDSSRTRALAKAAEQGKEVVALVELKARFDEASNIARARELSESGAHVVYGPLGLETHAEMLLVTRREGDTLARYLHVGTGNYNPATSQRHTDISLLTCDPSLTHDAMLLFNVLTGYGELPPMKKIVVAPFGLREHVEERLEVEIAHHRAGRPAGLVAQLNSLADRRLIASLVRASLAGVPIDLLVRGVCCLRPGLPGSSPTIRVRSLLDRFLEHSRIFCWRNGGEPLVYSGSADWTPSSLDERVEVLFPIEDSSAKRRILDEILPIAFEDDRFSWEIDADGSHRPRDRESGVMRAQARFMELAEERARRARKASSNLVPPRVGSRATRAPRPGTRRRNG